MKTTPATEASAIAAAKLKPKTNMINVNPRSKNFLLRSLPLLLAVLALLAGATQTWAGSYAWALSPSGNVFSGNYWTSGTTPGAAGGTPGTTDNIYFGPSSVLALNNDRANNYYTFSSITFNSDANAFTFSGNDFKLNGNLANNSTSPQIIGNNFSINAADRTVSLTAGGGDVTLNGIISQDGTARTLYASGAGTLTLSGANTFTAGAVLNSGATIVAANAQALGQPATGKLISLGDSATGTTPVTLRLNTAPNAYNLALGTSGKTGLGNYVYPGIIQLNYAGSPDTTATLGTLGLGRGTLTINAGPAATGTPVLNFSATGNTFSGNNTAVTATMMPIGVNVLIGDLTTTAAGTGGTLQLDGTSTGNKVTGIISDNGAGKAIVTKANTSTWTLSGANNSYTGGNTLFGGTLILDYSSGQDNKKLGASGVLTLDAGTIQLKGGSTTETPTSTTIGSSTAATAGQVRITRNTGTSKIALLAITLPTAHGAIDFADGTVATTTTANLNGILSVANAATFTVGGSDWACNDGSGNIIAYPSGSYAPFPVSGVGSSSANYSLSGSGSTAGGFAANTLKITTSGSSQSLSLGGTFTLTANGILFNGANDYAINGTGKISATSQGIMLNDWGSGTLSLGVAANAATGSPIDKYGTGKLKLVGNIVTASGNPLNVYAGTVQFSSNDQVGTPSSGNPITLNGGGIIADTTSGNFALDNAGASKRGIVVGQAGGTIDVIGGNKLTISGIISSSAASGFYAPLTLGSATSSGTIVLSGTNTFYGSVVLAGGVVSLGSAQTPAATISGTTTASVKTITGITSTAGLAVGQMLLTASMGLSAGNTIASIDSSSAITMANAATATGTGSGSFSFGANTGPLGNYLKNVVNLNYQYNLVTFTGGTLQYSANNSYDYSDRFSTLPSQSFKIDTFGQNVTYANALQSAGGSLTLNDTAVTKGSLTLNASPAYSGQTTITAGTLKLGSGVSLNTSSGVSIAAGATFDVSAQTTYTLGGSTTLSASGTGTSSSAQATLKGGTTVSLGSQGIALTYAGTSGTTDTTHPSLVVSQGALTLNNNAFTINGASPLGVGTYTLISVTGGTINQNGSPSYSVTGTAIDVTKNNVISVSGGSVILTVSSLSTSTTTTVSRSAGASSSTYGSALTFKAAVVPGSGSSVPTGTVQFQVNGANFGSPVNVVTDSGANGKAEISGATLAYSASAYTVTAVYTASGSFTGSSDATGISQTITAKALTVTATGSSKTYGTALSAGTSSVNFTAGATGVGSETVTSVTLTPDTAGATATTAAGTAYVVTPSLATGTGGFLAANYNINYVAYNGTVAQAALTITANGDSKTYGQTKTYGAGSTAFGSSGLQNGETIDTVTITDTDSGGVATAAGGTYHLTPSAATGGTFSAANYSITYNPGTLTVTPANAWVTANPQTKTYGDVNPMLTAVTNGAVNGDVINVTIATTATQYSAVGQSNITVTAGSNPNYTVLTTNSTLTIGARPITITAQPNTKIYDGGTSATNVPALTSGTLATGDGFSSLTEAYSDPAVGTGKTVIPSTTITNESGTVTANYVITADNDTSSVINPAQATTSLLLTNNIGVTNFYGQTLIFTAVVQTNSVTPADASSNIVFLLGNTPVWTNAVVNGIAIYTNDDQTVGVTNFTAQYLGDNNYLGSSLSVTQTVLPATPTLTLTASAITYGQDLSSSSLADSVATNSYDVDSDGDEAVAGSFAFASSGIAPNAGTTNVLVIFTPTDTNNYTTASNTVSVTVNKANSSVTVTGTTSFIYDGAGQGPASVTVTGSSGVVSYSYSGTGYGPSANTPTNAGSYAVTATVAADDNYNSATSSPTAFNISPAAASVTAEAKTKTYGTLNPTLTATVVGQVIGGDTISYSLSTDAAQYSAVGVSNILVTLGSNPNYSVAATNGTLTIYQANTFVGASSTKNPSGYKDTVAYIATLPVDATGSVVFSSTNGPISTNTLSSGSTTSLSITNLPRGTNIITVAYLGDGNYAGSTNTLDQIVTNHPPVANAASYTRNAVIQQIKIAVTNLLSNATDLDGDPLTLASVSATTNAAALIVSGGWVMYYSTNAVNDQFTYTVSDGFGGTNSATVTLAVDSTPVFGQSTLASTTGGTATLNFAGIPTYSYSVMRSTNLSSWAEIWTTNAPGSGVFQYIDLAAPQPSAYYQLRYNP